MKKSVRIYLAHTPSARKQISRIGNWKERKTLRQNAVKIGINIQQAQVLGRKFSLRWKKKTKGRSSRPLNFVRYKAIKMLRRNFWTMKAIGDVFGMTRQGVNELLTTHNGKREADDE